MLRAVKAICVLLCLGALASAADVVVDPSSNIPAAVRSLADGDTLTLRPGVYDALCFRRSLRNIIVRAQYPGRAWIRPRPPYECGVYSPNDVAMYGLTIEGLDITAPVNGVNFWGSQDVTVRDCHVHHAGNQGIALHHCDGSTVQGCLIEYNGTLGSNQRHGLYASGDRITVRDNCFRSNSGWAVHLWPFATRAIVSGNLILDHPRGAGIVYQRYASDTDPANANRVTRNTIINAINGVQALGGIGDVIADNTCTGCTWGVNLQGPAGRVYLDGNIGSPLYNPSGRGYVLPPATQPAVSRAGAWRGVTSQPAEAP